jgi:hypothetical protein
VRFRKPSCRTAVDVLERSAFLDDDRDCSKAYGPPSMHDDRLEHRLSCRRAAGVHFEELERGARHFPRDLPSARVSA